MSILKVFCETCREHVAYVDTDNLEYPAVGSMFKSPDEKHGMAPPFEEWSQWELMYCPHGRQHRITDAPQYIIIEGGVKYPIPTHEEVMARGTKEESSTEEGKEGSTEEEVVDDRPVENAPLDTSLLCRVCGKQFKSKFALSGHMRSHKPGDVV